MSFRFAVHSYQWFIGINLDQEIPDFFPKPRERFKEALSAHNLDQRIFELINQQLEDKGLMIKKGTIADASILPSSGRALSDKKREELSEQPSTQIDTDAKSTRKGGRYYFGYKGHLGVDVESKLIRKATFTPVNTRDSRETEKLVSYDEKALFGDKAYLDGQHKYSARHGTSVCVDENQGGFGCHASQKPDAKPAAIYLCLHWVIRSNATAKLKPGQVLT